jgi:hypothetical protein
MRRQLLIAGLMIASAATRANAAPAASTPPAVKQDLQCFVLYTIAAGTEKDEKRLASAVAGTWYFIGRIDAAAPGLDLGQAMRAEIADLEHNPKTEAIGAACDAQFAKRGADMTNLGKAFEKPAN